MSAEQRARQAASAQNAHIEYLQKNGPARRGEESINDLESYLKGQLAEMQREYRQRAEPIIRQLCKIESMRPPRPIVIDASMIDPAILAEIQRRVG